MQPAFTIKEAVSFGWKKTLEHWGFLALLTLGFFVISMVIGGAAEEESAFSFIFEIANVFVSYLAMYTFVRIGLRIYRGEAIAARDVFDINWQTFGLFILSALVSLIVTGIGFILLIIPGVILTVRLGFSGFALLDQGLGPIEAIKKSWAMTRGYFWKLFGFSIVLGLINILGALALGIGLLITTPLCLIATVYAYERVKMSPTPTQNPVPTL
jgi:uncharacterized membrane protein